MSLASCTRCRRLAKGLAALRKTHPDWHNAPVPPAGPQDAPLLIVGLAPGKNGANRTGVPFVGDPSSHWLRARLVHAGLLSPQGQLQGVRITNAVKCLPPANRPTGPEIRECATRYLSHELREPHVRAVLNLGGVAHRAVNTCLGIRQKDFSFAHGAQHMAGEVHLLSAFHPSPLNTQTGRLSPAQFDHVLARAVQVSQGIVQAAETR